MGEAVGRADDERVEGVLRVQPCVLAGALARRRCGRTGLPTAVGDRSGRGHERVALVALVLRRIVLAARRLGAVVAAVVVAVTLAGVLLAAVAILTVLALGVLLRRIRSRVGGRSAQGRSVVGARHVRGHA